MVDNVKQNEDEQNTQLRDKEQEEKQVQELTEEVEAEVDTPQHNEQAQEVEVTTGDEPKKKPKRRKGFLRKLAETILGSKITAKLSGETLKDATMVGRDMARKGMSFGGSLSNEKTGALSARSTAVSHSQQAKKQV